MKDTANTQNLSTHNDAMTELALTRMRHLSQQNSFTAVASHILTPAMILLALWLTGETHLHVLPWFGLCILFCGLRLLHHRLFFQYFESSGKSLRFWEMQLLAFAFLSGLIWSGFAIAFIRPEGNLTTPVFMIAVLFTHVSGAGTAYATHMRLYFAFVLAIWAPSISYFLWQGGVFYQQLSIFAICATSIMAYMAYSQHQSVVKTLHLRSRNDDLVDQLKQQKVIAEEASRAKSRFLAAASHDLRQPMQALGLFADSLIYRITDAGNRRILDLMRSSLNSLSGLLDSLLDISRLDSGAVDLEVRTFSLPELFQRLCDEFKVTAGEKGLSFRCRCPPVWVCSDPVLLEQLLRNLLWNAVKYTDNGGVLFVARRRGEHIRIEVWDTGVGIPDAEQATVFEEFHQLHNPERDRTKGIGLGLSIVDRLSKLLGVRLRLRSKEGSGSVFALDVNEVSKPSQAGHSIDPSEGVDALQGVSVLVVDDEKDIQIALQMVFKSWGCRVEAAESLAEVDALLRKFEPQIVVTDYRLRQAETGDMVIDMVRRQLGRDLPAVIVTGTTTPEADRSRKLGNVDILYKPLESAELKAKLVQLLGLR